MDAASISPELARELRRLVAEDRTTDAIKRLREVTGRGLAEAKSWIEQNLLFGAAKPSPASVPLSNATRLRVELLFPGSDLQTATELLVNQCGDNLPFLEECGPEQLERLRFAALKLSSGRLDKLREAVALGKGDWRDLLMAAGFGYDIHAHERWMPASTHRESG